MNEALVNNLTTDEKIRYGFPLSGNDLEVFAADVQRETEAEVERSYEAPLEQSEFRRQALEDILQICQHAPARYKETKQLIQDIRNLLDNSYVEL